MKRLSLFLLVAFAAAVFAPLELVVSNVAVHIVPADVSAAPLGPGDTAVPATNSGTGKTNSTGFFDEKPVCVAVPIFAGGGAGRCPAGEVEIQNDPKSGGAIVVYTKFVLRLINLLIGGIIILVLVIAGIQYIISGGDPSNVKNAKKRVTNAVTALLLYLMMFAILNFLVPGGIL